MIECEMGDRLGESASLSGLGTAYNALGQHRQAIDFYQQSLEIRRKIGDRRGEAISLSNLGNAYYSLGQYWQAINFHQQSLAIQREIGDRHGEARTWLNKGNALARVDQKWEAQSSYEAARALYEDLGLQKQVETCDTAIRDLGKQIVAIPKQAPNIGVESPKIPEWQEKSMPAASPSPSKATRQQRVQVAGWFLVGLGLVLLIGWLVQ